MQARILDKSEEDKWGNFVESHPLASIHQHPDWGHFQAEIKRPYWIIVLEKDGKIVAGTLLVRHGIRGKYTWLYAPRGPLFDRNINIESQTNEILKAITPIAQKENAIFLRIDPFRHHGRAPLSSFKFVKYGFQPQHTLVIDISQTEEEILQQMKPKGRYSIKLAEKKGVKIHKSTNVSAFHNLLTETTERDGFHGHDLAYYDNMLKILGKKAALYLAEYNNETVAGLIVTYFKDTATYYYGVSGNKYRNVMAPYLLHWRVMKDAGDAGYKKYDLFGIAPEDEKNHPWAGVTEFKRKFGGKEENYFPAQEHPFKKILHLLYKIYKNMLK